MGEGVGFGPEVIGFCDGRYALGLRVGLRRIAAQGREPAEVIDEAIEKILLSDDRLKVKSMRSKLGRGKALSFMSDAGVQVVQDYIAGDDDVIIVMIRIPAKFKKEGKALLKGIRKTIQRTP